MYALMCRHFLSVLQFRCRCVIGSHEAEAFSNTMPVLQFIGCSGCDLGLDYLQFPWNQQAVTCSGNLRRSPAFQLRYTNEVGIASLPSNIYR